MLKRLTLQNLVLIDQVVIDFQSGLNVLTGETGAGKSILLDGLGLVLGERASQSLVRAGADRAVVHAEFELPEQHRAIEFLAEHDLDGDDAQLLLRRTLHKDGRSRAFINDQPVHLRLLKQLGEHLVEVHGQHSETGLTQQNVHREILDIFGAGLLAKTDAQRAYKAWREAQQACDALQSVVAEQRAQEDELRFAAEELQNLNAVAGEEEQLQLRRTQLRATERIQAALGEATDILAGHDGVDRRLYVAERALTRVMDSAGDALMPALEALRRASSETHEAAALIDQAGYALFSGDGSLNAIEERLFALREAARKYGTTVDGLPDYLQAVDNTLAALTNSSEQLEAAKQKVRDQRNAFEAAVAGLRKVRLAAAKKLDRKVSRELPGLKLEKAQFRTDVIKIPADEWGPEGGERVAFLVSTNPGSPPAPMAKIASGGELSRFMLALKVALSERMPGRTMVFDEVDAGIGGAVADKVGARLQQLAKDNQILVVTHAPQVAARGRHHMLIEKQTTGRQSKTTVSPLTPAARREEIARMLAGAHVTDAARRAADSLLKQPRRRARAEPV